MLVEVLEVALQQGRNVKVVGTAFFAEAALHAVVHLLHLLVKFVGEVDAIGSTTEEKVHPVAALYLDAHGARLAVAAPTAKVATQLLAVFLNALTHLVGQLGRILLKRDKLVQLALALDTPDGLDVWKLCKIGVCSGGVVDKASRQPLHGNKAHVVVTAALCEGMLLLIGKV